MKIKAATYNILHCEDYLKEKIDFEAFAEVVRKLDADVIGLNEVHGKGKLPEYEEQAEILGKLTGYNYFFAKATEIDGPNPFGNAVLTRLPVKEFSVIPIPDPVEKKYDNLYETRCILKMITDTDPQFTILITHFGLNPDEIENAVNVVIENITDENCIFMGDLNSESDNPLMAEIQSRMNDSAVIKEIPDCTFIADNPYKRIDYIFTSKNIKVLSYSVPEIVLSDHRPVITELEV